MECPYIPQIELEEFAGRWLPRVHAERTPISGTLELTPRCNLNCAHCYINESAGDPGVRARELTADQVMRIVDQAADQGLLWLLLTGGEIFLREDFLHIYEYTKRKGIVVSLFTNGTLLTPQIADFLAEWRPFLVEITLYGATQETYERVTRTPGSFERCMRGIELLIERDLPLRLKTMVLTLNQHELWDIKKFAEDLVEVPFRYDPIVHPRRENGSQAPVNYRLSPYDIVQLESLDAPRVDEWRRFGREHWGPVGGERRYFCGAGRSTFHIDALGQLSPCMMTSQYRYDLLAGSFQEGWHQWLPQVVDTRPDSHTPCQDCEMLAFCNNCPAWGEMEQGRAETAPVEFLCQLAHLRYETFDIQR